MTRPWRPVPSRESASRRSSRLDAWRDRLDLLPPVQALFAEWRRVEVIDRALAIGAQGLLAVLPLLVIVVAFLPDAAAHGMSLQLGHTVGLEDPALRPMTDVVDDANGVSANAGLLGVVVALVSATSFSRALQRMYAKVFELDWERRPGRILASSVWLLAWLGFLAGLGIVATTTSLPFAVYLAGALVLNVFFWWWTLHTLLLGDRAWSDLLPTALLTTAALGLLVQGSGVVMPLYARSLAQQFGPFGLVLAIASWMVAAAGVIVVSAVIGGRFARTRAWARVLDRAR